MAQGEKVTRVLEEVRNARLDRNTQPHHQVGAISILWSARGSDERSWRHRSGRIVFVEVVNALGQADRCLKRTKEGGATRGSHHIEPLNGIQRLPTFKSAFHIAFSVLKSNSGPS